VTVAPARLSIPEFIFRVSARPTNGSVLALVCPHELSERVAKRLGAELEIQGDVSVEHLGTPRDPVELVAAVQHTSRSDVILISGVDAFSSEDWCHLDLLRSRLLRDEMIVFLVSPSAIEALTRDAPNLASWIGGSVWVVDLASEVLSAEEREARLRSLREWSSRTDSEVLRLATEGSLPPEPEYVEWLILLKRPDLIGKA